MKANFYKKIKKYLRWALLSALVGIMAGLAATLFLTLLQWATDTRTRYPILIVFLPLAGLFIGLVYHHYGRDVAAGNNLILDEIHNPKKIIPLRMFPFILLGTLITHLFGGSAGREGTAVQMSASLADQIQAFFHVEAQERKALLVAGMGAGFGAAIGAPWAGAIFGMEVLHIGKLRLSAWFECQLSSFVAYYVSLLTHAPHSVYPKLNPTSFDLKTFAIVLLFGSLCGLGTRAFVRLTHFFEKLIRRWIAYPPFKPLLGGLLLILLYKLEGSYRYAGLGLPVIQQSFSTPSTWEVPLLKGFFTSLTLASGFKGGEFIPLVFMGATLGSALSLLFKVSSSLLASLGFAAMFAGAANTPIACTLMAMEIFGPQIGPYALLACLMSYYFSGPQGIYSAQQTTRAKHHRWMTLGKYLGELPKRFFKAKA